MPINILNPVFLTRNTILVKRLPMIYARFEVMDICARKITLRRVDGANNMGLHEVDVGYLHKNGYLLEAEAGPHPMEVEKKSCRKAGGNKFKGEDVVPRKAQTPRKKTPQNHAGHLFFISDSANSCDGRV